MNDTTYNFITNEIKKLFSNDFSGHDYYHTERVYKNAMAIASHILCDKEIVALAALLHDVDDPKIFSTQNNYNAKRIMKEINVTAKTQAEVVSIINSVSFKGTGDSVPGSMEGKIVQDADRLDALGAIGIARAFAYGGSHQRLLYDPCEELGVYKSEAEYHSKNGSTIAHFYEKLLRLKDLMNTSIAKEIAESRTTIMKQFLENFMSEWNCQL